MSDYNNPYQSPETQIAPVSQETGIQLTSTMLQELFSAAPWLKFLGIMGYIGAGGSVLMGLFYMVGSAGMSAIFSSSMYGDFGLGNSIGIVYVIMGLACVIMGVLAFFPAHFMFGFGRKIHNFRGSSSPEDLEMAFRNNKSLWKFNGIITIISLAAIPFVVILMVIVFSVFAMSGIF